MSTGVTIALALALGAGWFGFPGLLWDVAWHRTIGRDSFFSPPHVLMYTAVGVNGLVSAWALFWGRRRHGAPAGLLLGGVGVLVAVAGAALDEWWHVNVGKDVNLWSPPHLVGLAGAVLIVLGLAFALAAHTRYSLEPRRWVPRVILLCAFADLVHKAMVALDHYTLDAWGRTPDFYPFLLALFLPAICVAGFVIPIHGSAAECELDNIALARVVTKQARLNFVAAGSEQAPTCPSAEATCRRSAYLVPGDEVLTGAADGSYVCALFKSQGGAEFTVKAPARLNGPSTITTLAQPRFRLPRSLPAGHAERSPQQIEDYVGKDAAR